MALNAMSKRTYCISGNNWSLSEDELEGKLLSDSLVLEDLSVLTQNYFSESDESESELHPMLDVLGWGMGLVGGVDGLANRWETCRLRGADNKAKGTGCGRSPWVRIQTQPRL
ncbi:hypothetical protein PR048_031998 [Dryococelus australis]|uniref:Uncharacterized protein n=1 Tax=Dryococelus australis TaxID=614101 RepID=A0ABQ9G6V2_9NEOP|nr:hypothetical protein PR048_031998 [Dryococelus australis]